MKHINTIILLLVCCYLSATEYITGILYTDIRKCEEIQSLGNTTVYNGRSIDIISNKSICFKPGFKASSSNNRSLHAYYDEEDCCPCNGTLTDIRDNQTYNTARIADQVWLAENFDYNVPGSWPLHRNGIDFGRQYSWSAYMNGSTVEGTQGVCPSGWHIPTFEEILVLMEPYQNQSEVYDALIENGTTGFDALIHDYMWEICNSTGIIYKDFFASTVFGTSSDVEGDSDYRYSLNVLYKDLVGNIVEVAGWSTLHKCLYSSVRCIKDCSRSTLETSMKSTDIQVSVSMNSTLNAKSDNAFSINIYPNPSTGLFNLELMDGYGPINIKIFDLNGKKIKDISTNDNSMQMDLCTLKKGIYFISVTNDVYCVNDKLIIH
ncbi:MAG: T9SS type A sorting domain-containing protein [Bacteroidales bacterium]|nr:T9SS type A sorting domain-containing protein [Bacteroidales bacterium]